MKRSHLRKRFLSHLRKRFLDTKSNIDHKAYNTQRNLCVSPIKQAKKHFCSNLDKNFVTKKSLKSFSIDKVRTKSKITLIEKNTRTAQQNLMNKSFQIKKKLLKYLIIFLFTLYPI